MPTCWIAQLDYIAIGAMRALQEAGYAVPDDVSMIGYDDIALSTASQPSLTTTRINRSDCGLLAMQALVRRIRYPMAAHTVTTVGSTIVERKSVKTLSAE
jgi:DNA-binding LacI/PurR family transcriptional regulator